MGPGIRVANEAELHKKFIRGVRRLQIMGSFCVRGSMSGFNQRLTFKVFLNLLAPVVFFIIVTFLLTAAKSFYFMDHHRLWRVRLLFDLGVTVRLGVYCL